MKPPVFKSATTRLASWVVGLALVNAVSETQGHQPPAADNRPEPAPGSQWQQPCLELLRSGQWQAALDWCQQQLAGEERSDRRRAELTVLVSQCQAQRAQSLEASEADAAWREAVEVLRQFALRYPQSAGRWWIDFQRALILAAQGQHLAQLAAVSGDSRTRLADARTGLREAVARFDRIAADLPQQLRRPARPEPSADAWTDDELRSLAKQAEYQAARGLTALAETYPADAADRADALSQALERLRGWASGDPRDIWSWRARLDEVSCLRLLGERDTAAERLSGLADDEPPPALEAAFDAERMRLALARQQLAEALAAVSKRDAEQPPPTDGPPTDWHLARLETLLTAQAALPADGPPAQRAALERRVEAERLAIDAHGGPLDRARAQQLVARWSAEVSTTAGPVMLADAADAAYRAGKLDEAQSLYDRTAQAAREAGDSNQAFDMAYRAAAIDYQRNQPAAAADRFRKLAVDLWDHPRAPEAHLLAAHQTLEAVPSSKRAELTDLAGYRRLLEEHLRLWPQDPTAADAAWQLGRLDQLAGNWESAASNLRRVGPQHARFAEAVAALGQVYRAWIAQMRSSAGDPAAPLAQAEQYFRGALFGAEGQWPTDWTPGQREAVVELAELWLAQRPESVDSAAELLDRAMAVPCDDAAWNRRAALCQAWATSARGDPQAAAGLLARRPRTSRADMVALVERCTAQAALLEGRGQPLVKLGLALAELFDSELVRWTSDERQAMLRAQALLLAQAGEVPQALERYAELVRAAPADPALTIEFARSFSRLETAEAQRAALRLWREVERRSRPGTQRWYQAKSEIVELHLNLGEVEQARKVVRVTRALHPDLGGADWQPRWEALERRIDAAGGQP